MAVVSISEAARLTGKSRKTIQRYVADGRMSMSQHVAGRKGIDIAELIRVFGNLSQFDAGTGNETKSQHVAPENAHVTSGVTNDTNAQLASLQAENALLKAQIESRDAQLEVRNAQLEAQAANLADLRQSLRLLEHKPSKRRWWHFGK